MSDQFEYQSLANKISNLIRSGIYKVGTRLPSEQDIANSFNVSRTCVRDAKIVLEERGFLERRSRSGAYVKDISTSQYRVPFEISPLELIQARASVEVEAAALAAPIITDEVLSELKTYVDIMSGLQSGDMSKEQADAAFHMAIASATNNKMIVFIVRSMWRIREDSKELQKLYRSVCDDNPTEQKREHQKILNALRERSPHKSRMAMREHFDRTLEYLIDASEKVALEEIRESVLAKKSRFLLASQLT